MKLTKYSDVFFLVLSFQVFGQVPGQPNNQGQDLRLQNDLERLRQDVERRKVDPRSELEKQRDKEALLQAKDFVDKYIKFYDALQAFMTATCGAEELAANKCSPLAHKSDLKAAKAVQDAWNQWQDNSMWPTKKK